MDLGQHKQDHQNADNVLVNLLITSKKSSDYMTFILLALMTVVQLRAKQIIYADGSLKQVGSVLFWERT